MAGPQTPGERQKTVQSAEINWSGVFFGGLLLVLLVAVVDPIVPRILAAVAALAVTFYIGQVRQEREVETPLLEEVRKSKPGLDRRKYGRLRQATGGLLSSIRQLNRIAVDARSGKITHRHASSELDRIASKMKEQVDQARRAAGIPTPVEEPTRRRRTRPGGGPASRRPDGPADGPGTARGE